MAFQVGSIEAELVLQRSAFTEGLRLAREQADAFERNSIEAYVVLKDGAAKEDLAALKAELEDIDHTRATPEVKVDTRQAGQGIGLLGAAIIALGPAAIAAGGVAAGALAPIAVGVLGVSAVALPALKNIHDAATKTGAAQEKALNALGPGGQAAVASFKALEGSWHSFQAQINPALFTLIGSTFQLIAATLPAFVPLFIATAHALNTLVQGLTPLAPIFAQAFARMAPIITQFTDGILHMAQALAHWTQGQGFLQFIAYVQQVGPQLVHTLGAIAGMFVQLGIAASPLLPIYLNIISALSQLLTLILKIPVIGPALIVFASIAVIAAKVGGAITALSTKWEVALPIIEGVMARIGAGATFLLANPVIAAAAAIIAALAFIITHWQQTVAFLKNLWQGALDAYNSTIGLIPGLHIGPDANPNILNRAVDQVRQAQHGGGGDFSGPNSGPGSGFGGGDFTPGQLTAGTVPTLTSPTIGKVPKITVPKVSVPKVNVPKIGTVHIPGVGALPVTAIPHTGGSSVPHATGGTQQAITGGGLAGPRTITDDFGLGPDIVGQTVQFRHSPNYGTHQRTQRETLQIEANRHLRKISETLDKQGRPAAAEVIKLNIGNRSEQISTEIRRRGRAPGKR